jgi:hypothetical protein
VSAADIFRKHEVHEGMRYIEMNIEMEIGTEKKYVKEKKQAK